MNTEQQPESNILFDQHSRLKTCAKIIESLYKPGDKILDVGSGPECLLGIFLPGKDITYVDPLLKNVGLDDERHIPDMVYTPRLDVQTYEHVISIDALEHIPAQSRRDFLIRLSRLSSKSVILLFPSQDQSEAADVDKAVNEVFLQAFGHEYPWLKEHFENGLPKVSDIEAMLVDLGWSVGVHGQGNSILLREVLPILLTLWECEDTKEYAHSISQAYVDTIEKYDIYPPFYRSCLIATREVNDSYRDIFATVGGISKEVYRDYLHCLNVEICKAISFQADRLTKVQSALLSRVDRLENELDISRLTVCSLEREHAEQVSVLEREHARAVGVHDELMRMSDWASYMKTRLDGIDRSFLLRNMVRIFNKFRQLRSMMCKELIKKILPARVVIAIRRMRGKDEAATVRRAVKETKRRVIVVFPIITWAMRYQRPQHLLSRLARRGNVVLYVSISLTPRGALYKNTCEVLREVTYTKLSDNVYKVWLCCEKSFSIYSSCLRGGDFHNVHMALSCVLNDLGVSRPIFFVEFPSWYNLVKALYEKFKGDIVFDCMDEHSGFDNVTEEALCDEKRLIKESDLIIASSDAIYKKAIENNRNVLLVNNGTEFEHFHNCTKNGELEHLADRPIIGYYGAIADWFDWEIVVHCAKARSDWNFCLIGSTSGCNTEDLEKLPNVYLLGEKSYDSLPGYFAYFTVCTIPFRIIPLTLATNPVKFYEYLSAAKPIVSVMLPELQPFSDVCYLAKDQDDFLCKLDAAVVEKKDDELIARRLEIARRNSWDIRVDTIMSSNLFR